MIARIGTRPVQIPDTPKGQWSGTMTLYLCGQIMGGKNNIGIRADGHRYPRPEFEAWRNEMIGQLYKQVKGWRFLPVSNLLRLKVLYVPSDRKIRDIPALTDSVLHVLERTEIIVSDGQIHELYWQRGMQSKKEPGAEIILEAIG